MNRRIAAVFTSLLITLSFIVVIDIVIDIVPGVTGITIYVGGAGPGNFSTIQSGIDAANIGDTVFVYGGIYHENINIGKMIYLIGEDRSNTIIDGDGNGNVVKITTDWVTIAGFAMVESGFGSGESSMRLESTQHCSIHNNTIWNNDWFGIELDQSSSNTIIDNQISDNLYGIWLEASSNNLIRNNTILNNIMDGLILARDSNGNSIINNKIYDEHHGINLMLSECNNITNNDFINCGILLQGSNLDQLNTHTIPENNMVNGKPLYYHTNSSGFNIDNIPVGQLIIVNSSNIIINNLHINNTAVGITMAYATNIKITNNSITNNVYGIDFDISVTNSTISNNILTHIETQAINLEDLSNGNIISNNTISFYHYGIRLHTCNDNRIISNNISNIDGLAVLLASSSNNVVYHNNFINVSRSPHAFDNTDHNIWNDTYPSGGNYWSEYGGVDNYKGLNQDVPGKDGMGDTDYLIDSDSMDHFPLMGPYPIFPTPNYLILKQGWNLISIPLSTTA